MKLFLRVILCLIISLSLYVSFLQYYSYFGAKNISNVTNDRLIKAFSDPIHDNRVKEDVVIAVVVCGDRKQETLVMIKSAIIFGSNVNLEFIILTEKNIILDFEEKLTEWVKLTNSSFSFQVLPIKFPENGGEQWRSLFKPCASQRLFLPSVLQGTDAVLYVDTDTIFLAPLENIWGHFSKMNRTQLAALSPEHEDPNTGWYNRFAKHPYYGPLGVNSGVMLMNLTRMRGFGWESYLEPILHEYKLKITWGDQDIINIIFHYHPECLYVYDCSHNYRSDHCMYWSVCRPAEDHGVRVLHGSRSVFHSTKQPAFAAVFNQIIQFQIGSETCEDLVAGLEASLDQVEEGSNCGRLRHIFTMELHKYLDSVRARHSLQ